MTNCLEIIAYLIAFWYIEHERAFDNAVQDDLWQALQQQANQDNIPFPATIKEIMETWTSQMGYPVIAVTRNYQTNTTLVSQVKWSHQRKVE